jgi:hypothetical protein
MVRLRLVNTPFQGVKIQFVSKDLVYVSVLFRALALVRRRAMNSLNFQQFSRNPIDTPCDDRNKRSMLFAFMSQSRIAHGITIEKN